MFKAEVKVTLKKGVLDPQGTAVERACKSCGYGAISAVRIGKVIELVIDSTDQTAAEAEVRKLADQLLANPVMEDYTVHLEKVQP